MKGVNQVEECSVIIADCLHNNKKSCILPTLNKNVVRQSYENAVYSNPLLFNAREYVIESGRAYIIFKPQYLMTESEYRIFRKQCEDTGNKLFHIIDSDDNYEFLFKLHHEIMRKIVYKKGVHAHSIIGSLIQKTAVCEGISMLIKYMCNLKKIECDAVLGKARKTPDLHMWVQVKLENDWYNIDATFDLTSSPNFTKIFDYFLVSDNKLTKSHYNYSSKNHCTSDRYDYYKMNDLIMVDTDALRRKLRKDRIHSDYVLSFQILTESDDDMSDKVMRIVGEVMVERRNKYRILIQKNPHNQIYHIHIEILKTVSRIRGILSRVQNIR